MSSPHKSQMGHLASDARMYDPSFHMVKRGLWSVASLDQYVAAGEEQARQAGFLHYPMVSTYGCMACQY